MKKSELPQKTCPVCRRPFSWRKKWHKVWDDVRYCSAKCRSARGSTRGGGKGIEIAARGAAGKNALNSRGKLT